MTTITHEEYTAATEGLLEAAKRYRECRRFMSSRLHITPEYYDELCRTRLELKNIAEHYVIIMNRVDQDE